MHSKKLKKQNLLNLKQNMTEQVAAGAIIKSLYRSRKIAKLRCQIFFQ